MDELSRADLWSLEEYAEARPAFRQRVMAHKKHRQLALGAHARLLFEDALTIKYQVQEMLRIEKIFEARGIHEELAAYNPLIPDGGNWKATFMIEYSDPAERAARLRELVGIEQSVWLQVAGCERIHPIANEDLERSSADKTASVHFLRFELDPDSLAAARAGAGLRAGIDHHAYTVEALAVAEPVRASLQADLA
ncbi:DUF3501 family protein [Parahaliea mediterranea]|uniref:DUF3501 family protein n=1 Tax=Parahaliea mediterranea TaxID=651086 RepID=A0A939DKC3_9GAMM|nr:DUF3501 family protein [Parahaliea mediterranea]MBN7799002.1 DUF3501 family protein [Parahaliea mediterranea]